MKWSYRSVILAGLLGMLLAGWVANRSSFSANNDAYLQVLAADGFRDGSGYGFHQNGEFISISARTMMSRWPPGLTALAAGLAKLGRDPLVSIVSIYPVLILATYLVLAWSLAGYLGAALACWTAFGALTPWCVMTYHSKLSTEPFALLFAAVLFALILQRKPTQTGSLVGRVVLFVVAAVGLTMFRNAGAYLVVVGVPLFVWFHGAGIWPRLRLAIVMGLCSLLPLMTFHWIAKAQSMKVAPPAKGGAGTGILSQLNGNLEVFAEALVPRISFLDARHSNLAAAIGWGLVLFVAASGVRELARRKWDLEPREDGDGLRVVMVGLALALACVVMLAVSADQFGYDWSSVYRVKGFALPWIIAAFASGLVLLTAKNPTLRPLVMAVIILTSSARFMYAWRAPLPDLIIPLCAVDYRGATDKMLQAVAAPARRTRNGRWRSG